MRSRDCKHNVHDVDLVGGSARIAIVQKMIQESFNGKEERFVELVVLPSTHTGNGIADEFGKQDHATGETWKNKSPSRLAVKINPVSRLIGLLQGLPTR